MRGFSEVKSLKWIVIAFVVVLGFVEPSEEPQVCSVLEVYGSTFVEIDPLNGIYEQISHYDGRVCYQSTESYIWWFGEGYDIWLVSRDLGDSAMVWAWSGGESPQDLEATWHIWNTVIGDWKEDPKIHTLCAEDIPINEKLSICHVDDLGNVKKLDVNQNALFGHLKHGDVYPGDNLNEMFTLNRDCMKVCRGIEITGGVDAMAALNGILSFQEERSGRSAYESIYGEGYIWWDPEEDFWLLATGLHINEVVARGSGDTPDTVIAWEVSSIGPYVPIDISLSCTDGGSCKSIEISGVTGETALINGAYSYLQEYQDRGVYGHSEGTAYIWWDSNQGIWVIGTMPGDDDSVLISGFGGVTPGTVAVWGVPSIQYVSSGISSSCHAKEECPELEGYDLYENLSQDSFREAGDGYARSAKLNECAQKCYADIECVIFSYHDQRCYTSRTVPSDLTESAEVSCSYIPQDMSDKCPAIEITGATGAAAVLNGFYTDPFWYHGHLWYAQEYSNTIWWDPVQALWVIGTSAGIDDFVLARGSGGNTADTVVAWQVRDNSAATYTSSGISSLCAYKGDCQRPSDWCTDAAFTYVSYDCDSDGHLDNVCYDTIGNNHISYSSDWCIDSERIARVDECPDILVTGHCPRPSDWCTDPGSTYVAYDCDDDGDLDNVCYDTVGNNHIRYSSQLCTDSGRISRIDECPEILVAEPCQDIQMTGATGATTVLNGVYYYLQEFQGRNAYGLAKGGVYIWWEPEPVAWVIGAVAGEISSALARGSGVGTPDTVTIWESRDNSEASYISSDISSSQKSEMERSWCWFWCCVYSGGDCVGKKTTWILCNSFRFCRLMCLLLRMENLMHT